MLPNTTTLPMRWVAVRRPPYLMKSSRPLNLVVRPRLLWRYLDKVLESAGDEPLALVLRLGDLTVPSYLANFRYLAGRIASHPGLARTRFARVDDAVERFAMAH